MKKNGKRFLSIILSLVMVFSFEAFGPTEFQNVVKADETLVTSFSYDFAYSTPGYADGTIYIDAKEDGVYKVFWGDEKGEKLKKSGHEYSYFARVVVQDGKGSFNIINDYTAIPEGAKTVLVYKKNAKVYTYDIPEGKQFIASKDSYTFGSISDPHFGRYTAVADDDAVPAMDNAMNFLDEAGIEFVAMSGDLTAAGEQTSLDKFNAALAKHPDMTVLTAIGNHDSRVTLSTSDKSKLDTSITRWYNSITSTYFTVEEDGTVNNKLNGYEILANDALQNPITTYYRAKAGGEDIETTVPGLDFVTEAGGNIFIFFNNIAKTGETYNTEDLVSTGQMDWLKEQLETYKDKNVFLYQHYYLPVNTLNNDVVDKNNCTGDLKNSGGYSYDLDFDDVVTTTDGENLQALLMKYRNTTLVSGHSHWQYSMQGINKNLNFGRLANGNGGTMIHLSSVTEPRYIADEDESRTSLNGYVSEGATVTTYDDCTVYNNIDFTNEQYEAYATYIVPTGSSSQYEPAKNAGYSESTTAITGDDYCNLPAGTHTFKVVAKSGDRFSEGISQDVIIEGKDLSKCSLAIGEIAPVYNGSARTVPFTVMDQETQLEEDVDFTVSYKDNVDAGIATLILTGIGLYEGTLSDNFTIQKADIESDIVTKDFSNIKGSFEYKNMEIQPIVKMKQGDYYLSSMKDYEVEYTNNTNPGTATMTITGVGNYTGTITKTYEIVKRTMENASIKITFDENNKMVVTVSIPDNGRALVNGVDYKYTTVTDATGKITVTFTGIGDNCAGTFVKVIEAKDNPNRPVPTTVAPTTTTKKITVKRVTIKKVVNQKGKKVKLTWKKASGVSGYNVRYALSKSKLKKAKIKKVKKSKVSYVIKKLKKKRYYIQVRAYKVVNKKTYYGAWSKAKRVRVNK